MESYSITVYTPPSPPPCNPWRMKSSRELKQTTTIKATKRHQTKDLMSRPIALQVRYKTEFARGPGRGDTCHLSNLDETLPD